MSRLFYFLIMRFMPPNGHGKVAAATKCRSNGIQSARAKSCPIVTGCFARAKSSTAGSVSLSDWLGGKHDGKPVCRCALRMFSFLILFINIAPSYDRVEVSIRDDTTFLQTLQLESQTAYRFIFFWSLNQKMKLK